MGKFINPFTDYGFKRIFGQEMNKELLINFLNDIFEDQRIIDLTFLNSEVLGNGVNERIAVFDIFCENINGEKFVVEVQQRKQDYFKDRALFYASSPIRSQGMKGRWNFELMPVYVICFLNFVMDKEHEDKYRWDVVLMEKELKEVFYNKLDFIFFEMPKFRLSLDECDTNYKKWLYILNNMDILDRLPPGFNEQIFQKLKEISDVESLTPEERLAYDLSWSAYNDYYNTLEYAIKEGKQSGFAEGREEGLEKGKEEGREEGREEGKKQGKEEGKEEGLAVGRQEGLSEGKEEGKAQEKIETARKMKEKGIEISLIAEITGLSKEKIEKL